MNKDTLVLLSGMAPKEPEQWALDDWLADFNKEYPEPWSPCGFSELVDASEACLLAATCGDFWFSDIHALKHAEKVAILNKPSDFLAWECWRNECLGEWLRNEWPLLWAKKRMQAAGAA